MDTKVIAEVSVLPLGTGGTSMSSYVTACVKVLEKYSDIRFQVTPMGTVLEGNLDRVLAAVEAMHEVPFGMGVKRVVTDLKIDDRRDRVITMESKVEAVARKRK
ncbi:MAG: MTH1187 family thiamine-binding protein [Chloroflexi bacterium]|nr:MTH1187 family thiamine-binding protein [Chloroflexota bacterium]